jgi:hypothetical protein
LEHLAEAGAEATVAAVRQERHLLNASYISDAHGTASDRAIAPMRNGIPVAVAHMRAGVGLYSSLAQDAPLRRARSG